MTVSVRELLERLVRRLPTRRVVYCEECGKSWNVTTDREIGWIVKHHDHERLLVQDVICEQH